MFKYLIMGMLVISTYTQHTKRTVLLFADQASQNVLKQQQRLLEADKTGLQQRDIEIKIYHPKDAAFYKHHYVRGGFTILLIGKDGGEKLRSHQPVTAKKLFELIDTMPMRKDEMAHGAYQEE